MTHKGIRGAPCPCRHCRRCRHRCRLRMLPTSDDLPPSHTRTFRHSQATTGEAFSIALAIYAAVCLGILLAFTW